MVGRWHRHDRRRRRVRRAGACAAGLCGWRGRPALYAETWAPLYNL